MRERIGSYRIERELGHGGMGVVFKARHDSGRVAALKTIHPACTADAEVRERLIAEAKTHASLRHPHVVTFYEPVEDNGELFLAIEYVDGESVADLLARSPGSRLPFTKALPLFRQLLDALEYVHGEKIIHRDVTPRNVMVTDDGVVKLGDFGLALLAGEPRLTASLHLPGTPEYMSPEQLQAKELDGRSDLYSAALVLFRMLAGRTAFESKEYLAQVHERMAGPPALRGVAPEVPSAICEVISIALQFEPQRRFHTAANFREQLNRAESGIWPLAADTANTIGVAVPEPPQELPPPPPPSKASNAAAWLVTAFCVGSTAWMVVPYLGKPVAPVTAHTATLIPKVTAPAPGQKSEPPAEPPAPAARNRETPKPAPDLDRRPPAEDITPRPDPRRLEIDALREQVRNALTNIAAMVHERQFAAALLELDWIDRESQRYAAELWPEREDIAHLRGVARAGEAEDRFWKARLTAIENLIVEGKFPEAINLAKSLKNDPQAPLAIAARATDLQQDAERGLREAFQDNTHVGPTTNTIRKPSSPPRKNQ